MPLKGFDIMFAEGEMKLMMHVFETSHENESYLESIGMSPWPFPTGQPELSVLFYDMCASYLILDVGALKKSLRNWVCNKKERGSVYLTCRPPRLSLLGPESMFYILNHI